MKKLLVFLSLAAAVYIVSGCCLVHDRTEPSCTEASQCTKCGKTRGEALGHDWQADAGILICSRCGAVDDSEERAYLGITDESDASKQVTDTEKETDTARITTAEADFEKYGITTDMAYNELQTFTTRTRDMPALSTEGELAVTDFGVLPTDSAHPSRDGYGWRYVIMQATFYDDNARKNGVKVMALCEDYYNIALRGATQRLDADGYIAYTVLVNGEEMECRYKRTGTWSDWYTDDTGRREILYSCLWEIEIPDGYDGTVVGLYSSAVDWPEGEYINEAYSPEAFKLFRIS